jgi:hypothetical protein
MAIASRARESAADEKFLDDAYDISKGEILMGELAQKNGMHIAQQRLAPGGVECAGARGGVQREAVERGASYFGTLITVPPPSTSFVQYTLVASTAMPLGPACPDASVVGLPPPSGTFITVPSE